MQFSVNREVFLPAIQSVIGAIERRQTLPILSNIYIQINGNEAVVIATDLEIELKNTIFLERDFGNFQFTIPARKISDICKSLPENSNIIFHVTQDNIILSSNSSKFTLSILPAEDYPRIDVLTTSRKINLKQNKFKEIINNVSFAMAQQDVRYYLNGMFFEIKNNSISAVTTDGHRLALSELKSDINTDEIIQLIVPRKSVIELHRLVKDSDDELIIEIDKNHIRFNINSIILTSKLIDGKFPDYKRVIPSNNEKLAKIDKNNFKQALIRSSIISNEKFKGAKFIFSNNLLTIETKNSEKENSMEELIIDYCSEEMSIGFNISYILDIINVFHEEKIIIKLKSNDASAIINQESEDISSIFVVMPMRI